MTGWIVILGVGLLTAAAIIGLGRLPRAGWEMIGAAVLLGIAGYAWQGRPDLAGAPRAAADRSPAFDENTAELRRALGERFGKASQWTVLSDGLGRQGKTRESTNVLVSALRQYPQDADLWLGLGNALVTHGGGVLTPPADYAYRKSIRLEPKGVGGPYFYGLALARSGDLKKARDLWYPLLDRLRPDSELRGELVQNISLIDRVLAVRQGAVLP